MPEEFMQQYGLRLVRHGYKVIPISPNSKRPDIRNWSEVVAGEVDVKNWSTKPDRGIGILTGDVVGVDVDIDDRGIVREFTEYCQLMYGPCLVRRGFGNKVMLVYRTDTPGPKMTSVTYHDGRSDLDHRLELLGLGQQFVSYGIHPDTGDPYRWVGDELYDTKLVALSRITDSDKTEMIEFFDNLCLKGGYQVRVRSPVTTSLGTDLMESFKPPLDITDEQIQQVLAGISPEGHDDWIMVGTALHHQFSGGPEGLKLWDTWSQGSHKYKAAEVARKWQLFQTNRTGGVVSFSSVIHKSTTDLVAVEKEAAKEEGSRALTEGLEHLVHIAEGDMVADLRHYPHNGCMKLAEFRSASANIRMKITVESSTGKAVEKDVPVWQVWLTNRHRKSARRARYAPGQDQLFVRDGIRCYNTFAFPRHQPTDSTDCLPVFLNHIDHLFPNKADSEWFLSWLAHVVQRPSERPQVTPLHVSRVHGAGRGLLVRTMARLVGEWNLKKTTLDELAQGNYNEYLHESLFVTIEEANSTGNSRYEVNDQIRDKLTDSSLSINTKYGFKGTAEVFSRLFLMSNHLDALRLPPEDRRINVFLGPDRLPSEKMIGEYLQWLNSRKSIAQLFHWLQRRDISGWSMMRSEKTKARQQMIDYGRSETEELFFELLASPPRQVMTMEEVVTALDSWGGSGPMDTDISRGQVTKLMQEQCHRYGQVRIDGTRARPWGIVKPARELTTDQLREELLKPMVKDPWARVVSIEDGSEVPSDG